jgi:catecholate siderophore receptor
MDAAGTAARAGFSTGVVYMKPRHRPGRQRSLLSGRIRSPRKIIFWLHLSTGLTAGAVILVLSVVVTGVAMSYPPRGEGGPPRGPRERGAVQAIDLDGLDELWARAERQVPGWRSLTMRLPASADAPVAFTIARGDRGRPDLRAQLTLDRRSGAVVSWEPFASQSRGRRLRAWRRWVHTGAAVLVWTGFALAWRRFFPRRQALPAAESDPGTTPQLSGTQLSGRGPMKTTGKNRRKAQKKSGKPPRWLAYGVIAVSTMGATTTGAYALADRTGWRYRDLIAQALPAAPGRPGSAQAQETPVLRFDIPAGPLTTVLDNFRHVTGFAVRIENDLISQLSSPGVAGLLTPMQALQELLAGTGVTFELADPRTVKLSLQGLAETLDVIEHLEPAAPLAPASPKYTQPLLDTPQSITVIPQRVIEERGATTLREVLRNVTGISLLAGEGGSMQGDNLAIRGFTAQNDIFVDGVRDFGSYTRDPFDVEQVEVAKGPGSLYIGHGSTGGAVNLASKAPRLDAGRGATLAGGADQYGRATLDLNQPLAGIADAAFRVNGMWTHAGVPGRDAVENQRWGIAPSLAFGLGTATRTTVSYFHLDQDNVPDHGIPWVPATNVPLAAYANKPAPVDFDNFYGITSRDHEKTVTGIATAKVEHDFSAALTLRSILRHGRSSREAVTTSPRFLDTNSTVIRREFQSRDEDDAVLAQQNDLTFRFSTGEVGHVLVAGTELARETAENHARTAPAAPNTDLFNPDPGDPFTGPVTRTGARTASTAKTAALYAADTLQLGERWEVNAGLRWDRFDVDFKSVAVDGTIAPFGRTDEMVSWRAGLINKPRPNGSFYLAAGTSFNPSAEVNTGLTLTAATADLEPEKSRSFEAGTKWDFASSRWGLTAAVFQTEKVNAKTPGLNPGDPATVLQGEQRIRGLELGATGNLTDRWSAFFSYTFLKSKITKSNNAVEIGNEFANTPDHSVSLWTTYRLRTGFEIGAGGQYVGNRTNSTTTVRVAPASTVYDAMVSYPLNGLLTLRLNVNNLTDERSIDRLSGGHFVPGQGRSVAMTTSLNF